ncbi:MAG: DUF1570 domain-containing protein, partial [Planctomycetales bacterium]|nr:DUF1570 domain-containing protein [Planctomycetales bacterium]
RMEDVELARSDEQGRTALHYDGSWFTLDSTADEESTRRCVVRVEQIFRAYRQLLPPRSQPQAPLRVMIFGSQDEYNDYLQTIGASIANGAFYSQQANVIAAASELNRFADRLTLARSRHEELRKTYQRLDDGLPKQLAELGAQLRGQGFAERDVDNELNARRLAWRNEMTAALVQLTAADRRNEGRFVDVTQEMFERMYHEGFHAYLENYVFPHERHSVPIWLNEGLAQVFQSGRLEADMLRIDAPPADSLRLLQAELAGDEPMSLTDLLAAPQREFQEQSVQPQRAARLYAAAWGVAHYLTFHQPLLGSAALDEYVATDAEQLAPPARFERLVGVPLEKFEQQWRTTMADLHAPR